MTTLAKLHGRRRLSLQPAPTLQNVETPAALAFLRREWIVERLGWVAMAAVVLAALAGILGDGPLARARMHTADGIAELRYSRFSRARAPDTLQVSFGRDPGPLRLSLSRHYVTDAVKVEQITPPPASVQLSASEVTYEFHNVGSYGAITVDIEPRHAGRIHAELRVRDGAPLAFTQLVYP